METDDKVVGLIPARWRPYAVLAGGTLCMTSLGIVYSFGNLLPYLVSYLRFRVDPSISSGSLMWVQTLLSGVPFSMLVGGVLERSFGGRAAALFGCVMYTCAIAASAFTLEESYGWLLLTFGLLPSFGSGVAYNGVLVTAQRWFPHRVGFAGGIIVAGFGSGTFFIAPLQTAYVNPKQYTVNAEGYFTQDDLLDRVPEVFLIMAALFGTVQLIGLTFLASPKEELLLDEEELLITRSSLTVQQMTFSWTFVFLFMTLFFSGTWVQVVTGLYKSYALQFISSDFFLSSVGAISALFNCLSRIGWGLLADKTSYQSTMACTCVLGSSLLWLMPLVRFTSSPLLFLALMCGIFVCVGGTYSLLPFASSRLFGQEQFGIMYGMVQMSLSLAGVMSGLLGQFLLPIVGYDKLFLIVGGFPIVSFILTSVIHYTKLACVRNNSRYRLVE